MPEPTESKRPGRPERAVPTRRISFEDSLPAVPKYFTAEGDLLSSHVVAVLSGLFPDGEDFFVRSVRHFRDQVTDPELKRQVAGFIGQEAVHGREHRALNEHFARLGFPTKRVERMTRVTLELREKLLPPIANLAATAAFEHFTATLAELLLSDDESRQMLGHEAVRDLFVWHALEESEHKAVAFDVYKAVGGTERLRVWTMKAARVGFLVGVIMQAGLGVATDARTYRKGELRGSIRRMRHAAVLDPALWRALCDYDRPDFHPDDRDTTALVARWRDELFGAEGTLVGNLTTKMAGVER